MSEDNDFNWLCDALLFFVVCSLCFATGLACGWGVWA